MGTRVSEQSNLSCFDNLLTRWDAVPLLRRVPHSCHREGNRPLDKRRLLFHNKVRLQALCSMFTEADGTPTSRSFSHDVFGSTDFWPSYVDGRAVIGQSWKDSKAGLSDTDVRAQYKDATDKGDQSRRIVWA